MLRLNLGKTKHKQFYTLRKPGFDIPPENYLYECRPPQEVKIATGPIIQNKYGKITYRGGPSSLGKVSGDLTKAPRQNVRNVFLPQRQSFNPVAPRTARISEEQRKLIKQEDIARNGQLVQVSNKTLNRVFDKFDLFTISDKILEMKRTGKMSKEDVRSSALLKLTKEVMNAMREARVGEAKEAIDRIEAKHDGTIPRMDDLGNTPEEVAENPLLPLAMLIDADAVDNETFLLLEDLFEQQKLFLDPQTGLVNETIPLQNILPFDISEIDDGLETMRDGYAKRILTYIVEQAKGDYPEEMDEEIIEDDEKKYEEDNILGLPEDQPRKAPEPPREMPFMKQPINPPLILNPVEPTPEEVKEDEVYRVVESGNDVGEGVRKYLVELNNKLNRALQRLPKEKLDPTMYNYLKENQDEYTATALTLDELSKQPDSVLDEETKQREIEKYLNKLQDLIRNAERLSKVIGIKTTRIPTPRPSPPEVEAMVDDDPLTLEEVEEKKEPPVIPEQLPRDVLFEEFEKPVLDPKRYFSGEPLTLDEMKNPNIKRVGTREEVWKGLAIRTGKNQRTSLAREDLVFDRRTQKVKSRNAVLGAMSRRKPTRTKKK